MGSLICAQMKLSLKNIVLENELTPSTNMQGLSLKILCLKIDLQFCDMASDVLSLPITIGNQPCLVVAL